MNALVCVAGDEYTFNGYDIDAECNDFRVKRFLS